MYLKEVAKYCQALWLRYSIAYGVIIRVIVDKMDL